MFQRFSYDYIRRCGLEDRKFRRKMRSDWAKGAREMKMLTVRNEMRNNKNGNNADEHAADKAETVAKAGSKISFSATATTTTTTN